MICCHKEYKNIIFTHLTLPRDPSLCLKLKKLQLSGQKSGSQLSLNYWSYSYLI